MDGVSVQNNGDGDEGQSDGVKIMNTTTNFDEAKSGKLREKVMTPATSTFKEDFLPARSPYNTAIILPIITVFFIIACVGGCFYSRLREPKARMVSPSGVWDKKVKITGGPPHPLAPQQKAGVQLVKFSELSEIPSCDNGGDGI
jgi:hypothetical protein